MLALKGDYFYNFHCQLHLYSCHLHDRAYVGSNIIGCSKTIYAVNIIPSSNPKTPRTPPSLAFAESYFCANFVVGRQRMVLALIAQIHINLTTILCEQKIKTRGNLF